MRARILLTTVSLAAVGLAVAGIATYFFLGSFLTSRLDEQLEGASQPVAAALLRGVQHEQFGTVPVEGTGHLMPAGVYGALLDAEGRVVDEVSFNYGEQAQARPRLPGDLRSVRGVLGEADAVTTGALTGSTRFRLLALALSDGRTVIVAFPLTDVTTTQRRLLLIEGAVTALVLLAIGAAALWLTRLELRPLERMSETADAIADGDLSQRVVPDDTRTEVGRLGGALNRMLAQIEHAFAERVASEERLRQFVADASHELRTPVTSIRGFAELFRRGAADRPDDLANVMWRIEKEGARMGELVDELLLLARLDQGLPLEQERVDLRDVAAAAVEAARATEPDRPFDLDAPAEVVVCGDDLRLRQVADNLIANARIHTPAATAVHVRVGAENGQAILEVVDEGPGIAPADAARMFERFYRADESRSRQVGGAGLGLAIVRSVVEAHGGTITHRAAAQGGAVFTVTLPRDELDDDGQPPARA
ncbi:MAG: HAMP domain-containing histidine kinase [Actinobacteria bacterium]|nr:HAMP domain-containing histidine kinase [Actinomycetota bacterium]